MHFIKFEKHKHTISKKKYHFSKLTQYTGLYSKCIIIKKNVSKKI